MKTRTRSTNEDPLLFVTHGCLPTRTLLPQTLTGSEGKPSPDGAGAILSTPIKFCTRTELVGFHYFYMTRDL